MFDTKEDHLLGITVGGRRETRHAGMMNDCDSCSTGQVQIKYIGWTRRGNVYVTRRRKGRQGSQSDSNEHNLRGSYATLT